MDEATWLSSSDPAAMLGLLIGQREGGKAASPFLDRLPIATDRKMRLWACACAAFVAEHRDGPSLNPSWNKLKTERWYEDVENGTDQSKIDLIIQAWPEFARILSFENEASLFLRLIFNPFRPVELPRTKAQVLAAQSTIIGCCNRHADNMGCDCLSMAADPWLSSEVLSLAQTCYDLRDPAYFPLIWDALEEAGCQEEEIRHALAWEQRCPKCLGEGKIVIGRRHFWGLGNDIPMTDKCLTCNGTGWLPIPGEPFMPRGMDCIDRILGLA